MGFWSTLGGVALQMAPSIMNAIDAHKSRDFQKDAAINSIQWRVHDAKQVGIHPLAAIGAQTFNPSPVSADYSSMGRLGQNILNSALTKKQIEATDAETDYKKALAREARARAEDLEGQGSPKLGSFNLSPIMDGQGDSSPFKINPDLVLSGSPGLESNINPGQKYNRVGKYYFKLPQDSEAFSDEAPIRARLMYTWDDISEPWKVLKLKENWNNPAYRTDRERFLKSRPPSYEGEMNVWNEFRGQWEAVKDDGSGRIFKTEKNRISSDQLKKYIKEDKYKWLKPPSFWPFSR